MSTCFTPVAQDLRIGDQVTSLAGRPFVNARTVIDVRRHANTVTLTFSDENHPFDVEANSDVTLVPPF